MIRKLDPSRVNRPLPSSLAFDDSIVTQTLCQKSLRMIVDYRIIFNDHDDSLLQK